MSAKKPPEEQAEEQAKESVVLLQHDRRWTGILSIGDQDFEVEAGAVVIPVELFAHAEQAGFRHA
jgi:hypothetical protein